MQTLNVQFGSYSIGEPNHIHLDGWREIHGAERDLTILKTSGTRGTIVLNATFQSKLVEVTGAIEVTDPINQARDFLTAMVMEGQPLTIENDDGTFVYDGAYLYNPDTIFETRKFLDNRIIRFRLLFLCPKGFGRDTLQLTQSSGNITTVPYSGSITINGDTNPEPIITITVTDASTISDLFFTNLTTNQQISVTGITFADGDIVQFDTENKQVLYNNDPIAFNGVFPDFLPGLNSYQVTAAGANALILDQHAYNDEEKVFGSNWLSQSFQLGSGASISQLGFLMKKVAADALALYDDFADNSIDTAKWNISSQVEEVGQKLRLYQRKGSTNYTSQADTDNKTGVTPVGEPVTGFQIDLGAYSGLNDGVEFEIGVYNGTHKLWFVFGGSTGKMIVRQSGGYYGGVTDLTSQFNIPSQVSIIPIGSDLLLYADSNLVLTLTGKSIQSNSYIITKAWRSSGGSSSDTYFEIDNVNVLQASNANTDLTITIEPDTAGSPSGTPVTNGTLTIAASSVGDTFSDIIKQFATAPALSSATTYHVKIKQTGGDINNYYVFKKQNTNVLANGNIERSANAGSSWSEVTGEDLYLKLWSAFPTSFILNLVITYFPSYFNLG